MLIKKILTVLLPFASVVAEGAGASPAFTVGSPDMADGKVARAQFANVMGGDGDNTSPRIEWHNAPANARSFVVTLYDPDAPTGSGWWHWAVANIPASANSLAVAPAPMPRCCLPARSRSTPTWACPATAGRCRRPAQRTAM